MPKNQKKGSKNKNRVNDRGNIQEIKTILRIPQSVDLQDYRDQLLMTARSHKKSFDSQIYKFRQMYQMNSITQLAGSALLVGQKFILNNLDQAATFAALFDQYRLDLVVVRFRPVFTEAIPADKVYMPRLYTVIDLDDGSNPASIGALREYSNCVETDPCKSVARILIPQVSTALENISSVTTYGMGHPWVDIAYPQANWYGIKYGVEPGVPGQILLQTYTVEAECYWSFKSTR